MKRFVVAKFLFGGGLKDADGSEKSCHFPISSPWLI